MSFFCLQHRTVRGLTKTFLLVCLGILMIGCASAGPHGPALKPALTVSASEVNFNTVLVGKSATQTLHLSNTGTAPLTISAVTLKNQEFGLSGPSLPRTVLPSMGLDYLLSFAPTTSGNITASLTITSNATLAPITVALAGVGEKSFAALQVAPASVNFGNLKLQTTATQNITLQNTGDINVTINGITVAGSGFGYSNLSPGFALSPNQKVTFQVWFKPQAKGAAAGTISILAANLTSPTQVSVAGDGVTSTTGGGGGGGGGGTPPTQHTVHLTWNPSASAVAGYRVYRSERNGSAYYPLTAALSNLSYDDATVLSGTTYYYAVTAVDSSGMESDFSNQTTAVIPTP